MKNLIPFILVLTICITSIKVSAQADSTSIKKEKHVEKKWYESFSIRGYTQVRYNRLLETNENLGCEQCDKSWGKDGGFFIRRMRIIFYGQISKQVYFYIQPDIASSPTSDKLHFAQLRDAYFDIGLDKDNEFRFRIGQSKVPFGFENMQSSQNRLALDRNDALNSAVSNERDLGVFFYWATKEKRALFSELVRSGLKGSGDYGIIGLGAYNGQTANNPELNNEPHIVGRVTYPFKIKNQIIETGIQAYKGKFVLTKSNLSTGVKYSKDLNYLDQRVAASFIVYPKPFGIQAEYNVGKGPEFNKVTDSIEVRDLKGGYVQMMYNIVLKNQVIMPFVKYQYYDGGKKHEKDARSYKVNDLEFGIEWQPVKQFELVAIYTISERRFEDYGKQSNFQKGNLLRLQAQINF
ncbi:MAG: porin [Bacteroidota bacterium]|nr:porin [Bacteroidota bacterium]